MSMVFERESLHQEIWSSPMTELAKKYGLSDSGLRKVCVALAIPLPGRGFWARLAAGHQPLIPALPPTAGRTSFECRGRDVSAAKAAEPVSEQRNDDWLLAKIAFELDPRNAIVVQGELTMPHRLVAAAAKAVLAECTALQRSRERLENPPRRKPGERWQPNWEALTQPNWRDYDQRGRIMEISACALPMRVSIESADRALRIWDAIIKACEARGMGVSSRRRVVTLRSGEDEVTLRMSEHVDLIKPMTLGRVVENAVRRPTGRLRIFALHSSVTKFEDSAAGPLESQLNDVMVRIYRAIASQQAKRAGALEKLRFEEAAARDQEQARAAEAEAARVLKEELDRQQADQAAAEAVRQQEVKRGRLLAAEAAAWREAQSIRDYATHVKATAGANGLAVSPGLAGWVDWANEVAERVDPTSKRLLHDQDNREK